MAPNPEFDPHQVYMPPMEVAKFLDLSVMQVKELAWQHKLDTVKVFGRVMFYRMEVEKFAGTKTVVQPFPDAWGNQAKRQKTYGLPDNPVDVNTAPSHNTQIYSTSGAQK